MTETKTLPSLTVKYIDDETMEYWIENTCLIRANHDDHGWSGISAIDEALKSMAEILGVEIFEVEENGNEES